MKTIKLLFCLLVISLSACAQRPIIEDLPAITPEEAGFNQDSLNALDDFISGFEQNDFRGMVVTKNHAVAIEYYYTNTERLDISDIRSAGKSFTALLLGIAIGEGLVQNLEQNVHSFFPKDKYPTLHSDYKKVKIKDLLEMSAGLDADSNDWDSPGNVGHWYDKDEWLEYLLAIPLAGMPGEKWVYADMNVALIGAIIEETSGMSLDEFANEHVFQPLGIHKYYWYSNKSNQTVAAGTLFLSALDFAKIGLLVANDGKWADQQIVPSAYIQKLISHRSFDLSDQWNLWDSYGMLWYKNKEMINGKEVEFLWASGNGGNQLIVVPQENMAIALTSVAYGQRYPHYRSREIFVRLMRALE